MEKAILRSGLVIAFIPLIITLVVFPFLPETIPTHFTTGPDAWSDKWSVVGISSLFILPVISLIMCGLLYFLFPSICRLAKVTNRAFKNPKHNEVIVLLLAIIFLMAQIWIISLVLLYT